MLNIDKGYVHQWADFEWVEGALKAVRYLKKQAFRVVVVTNQSGVGRGLYLESDFLSLSKEILQLCPIDAVCYCPDSPEDNCPARKPSPGMLEAVDEVFGVSKSSSFLIGDKPSDLAAAEAFGIPGHHFPGGNLFEFVRSLVRRNNDYFENTRTS